jgi:Na+-translocating ferredoxin:NAD+ oxidoreductase subunit C
MNLGLVTEIKTWLSLKPTDDHLKGLTFPGGIEPYYGKDLTGHTPTAIMPPPQKVILPLSMHTGAPAKPMVAVGALVRKGQMIAEAEGYVSVPVHATISGKVTGIGPHPHPSGRTTLCITIESDGQDEWIGPLVEHEDYLRLSPDEIKKIVHQAGISGMGGAQFPTHVKLNPPQGKKVDTLILNGVECEPYLTADHRVMMEYPREILEGLKLLIKILGVERVYIGIEDNKPDAIRILSQELAKDPIEHVDGRPVQIKIASVRTKYPEGGEKQLIQAILNKEVPSGGLPMDIGVVMQNVATTVAVYEAVRYGRPLIQRIVTVTGHGIQQPRNVMARLGTRARDIIEFCGGFMGEPGKVVLGGPMMGMAQYTLDVPIVKGTGGILALPKEEIRMDQIQPCIRCAACVVACPVGLAPHMLSITAELTNFDEAKRYHPFDCIECGCCDYVCPSKRPIVHLIRYTKLELAARKKKEEQKQKK